MAATERNEDLLTDWELLVTSTEDASSTDHTPLHTDGTLRAILSQGDVMERLLMDAQRESTQSSRQTSTKSSQKGSPKSPHSPTTELATTNLPIKLIQEMSTQDFLANYDSRPEIQPPTLTELAEQLKHPVTTKPRCLSVRHTKVMKHGVFIWENLPALLVTHACSFFLGAAVMWLCMKKYMLAMAASTTD